MMDAFFKDLRYAIRQLLKKPAFTLVAVVTLALGIGANTAIFSVVYAVLLRPLPYSDPDRIVIALHDGTKPVSPADFRDWRDENTVFDEMAAASLWSPNLTGRDQPEQIRGLQATGNLFNMLGCEAALGRAFTVEEDQKSADMVVVLSDQLWKRRFGGDPAVIGQTLTLDGQSYTIIGVMPPSFQFPFFWATRVEMWTPLKLDASDPNRYARFLRVFARLKPDSNVAKAQTEMSAIAARIAEAYPETNTGIEVTVAPLHERVVGKVRSTLLLLLGAVAFVLMIACANVANLLLARASATRAGDRDKNGSGSQFRRSAADDRRSGVEAVLDGRGSWACRSDGADSIDVGPALRSRGDRPCDICGARRGVNRGHFACVLPACAQSLESRPADRAQV